MDRFLTPKIISFMTSITFLEICIALQSIEYHTQIHEHIKKHPFTSTIIGLVASCPIIFTAALWYAARIKRQEPSQEVDADQVAINVTNDPESFVAAMEAIKKYQIQDYENIEKEASILDENIQNLKDTSKNWFDKLIKDLETIKNNLAKSKKSTLEDGTDSHPGTNKRIEFGKQEIEKRKSTPTTSM